MHFYPPPTIFHFDPKICQAGTFWPHKFVRLAILHISFKKGPTDLHLEVPGTLVCLSVHPSIHHPHVSLLKQVIPMFLATLFVFEVQQIPRKIIYYLSFKTQLQFFFPSFFLFLKKCKISNKYTVGQNYWKQEHMFKVKLPEISPQICRSFAFSCSA